MDDRDRLCHRALSFVHSVTQHRTNVGHFPGHLPLPTPEHMPQKTTITNICPGPNPKPNLTVTLNLTLTLSLITYS